MILVLVSMLSTKKRWSLQRFNKIVYTDLFLLQGLEGCLVPAGDSIQGLRTVHRPLHSPRGDQQLPLVLLDPLVLLASGVGGLGRQSTVKRVNETYLVVTYWSNTSYAQHDRRTSATFASKRHQCLTAWA